MKCDKGGNCDFEPEYDREGDPNAYVCTKCGRKLKVHEYDAWYRKGWGKNYPAKHLF
jgi:hypothetical protein